MPNEQKIVPLSEALAKELPGFESGFQGGVTLNSSVFAVMSKPGVGKSSFVNSNPQAVILDTDRGSGTVFDRRATRFRPPSQTSLLEMADEYRKAVRLVLKKRESEKGKCPVSTLIFDTMDALVELLAMDLCIKENIQDPGDYGGGHGRGWSIIRKEITGWIDAAQSLGLGVGLILHTTQNTRTVRGKEKTYTQYAISQSFRDMVRRKAHHMFALERGTTTRSEARTLTLPDGRVIEQKPQIVTEECVWVRTKPGLLGGGDFTEDVKARLPFRDKIVLPPSGGWQVMEKEHDIALKLREKGEA